MKTSYMATLVASAPLFFTALSIASTLMASEYDSLSNTMSRLAGPNMSHPWIFQLAVIGYSFLILPLGPLLYSRTKLIWHGILLWTLVLIYSVTGILAAIFRDGYHSTIFGNLTEDEIHGFVSRLSFSIILGLIICCVLIFRRNERWHMWKRLSLLLTLLAITLILPFQLETWPNYMGLIQRIMFASTMLWVFVTALILHRPSHKYKHI
jgi:hypothetical membrane protein